MRRLTRAGAVVAVLGTASVLALPSLVDRRLNRVRSSAPRRPLPEKARALHDRIHACDLHADPLLWGRDLLARGTHGHVDVPRLLEGRVALQVLGVVTKTPRGLNIERNDDRSDDILLLAMASRWPPRTWASLVERALYQAERLEGTAARSGGRLVLVRTREDLASLRRRREAGESVVGAMLALEGLHAISGEVANLDRLHAAGFRMAAPSHFFDTEVGGSSAGIRKHGLTPRGREVIARMESLGMIVDLAHASDETIDDVLGMARRPVVVSHTGVRGTCDNRRNLSDQKLLAIAGKGGVIGIGYFRTAVCGDSPAAIASAIRHAVKVAGVEHVALGSDWDGAVATPFDAAGLAELTAALQDAGLDDAAIERIMGGNAFDLLERLLPPTTPSPLPS